MDRYAHRAIDEALQNSEERQPEHMDTTQQQYEDRRSDTEAFTTPSEWDHENEGARWQSFDASEQRRKFEKRYRYYDDYDVGESSDDFVGTDFEREVRSGADYYTMLGLNPDKHDVYTKDEIKSSYRRMAFKWHPDMNRHPEAGKKFRDLNQAYAILSDSRKRMMYHRFGKQHFEQDE